MTRVLLKIASGLIYIILAAIVAGVLLGLLVLPIVALRDGSEPAQLAGGLTLIGYILGLAYLVGKDES